MRAGESKIILNAFTRFSFFQSLQLESLAHIAVHEQLPALLAQADANLYLETFWWALHQNLYAHLPEEFRWVKSQEGGLLEIIPGELRIS